MKSILRMLASFLALTLLLAGCGGGGGSPGVTVGATGGTNGNPTMTVTVVDANGANTNSLSGSQSATVRAVLKDANNAPVPNAIVTFSFGNAALVTATPASLSALTDSTGLATINIKPSSIDAAGATSLTATGTTNQKTASATVNLAIGAAPLTVGTLAFTPAVTETLPAFSTAVLSIPVTSAGAPVTAAPGLTLASLCVADGTASLVAGTIANGVMTATYTNKGCTRGTDVITVSIGNSSKTINVPVASANIGTIQFVGTDVGNASIVLRGSGGLGRKESAVVTFKVVDQNNVGIPGVDVNFTATTYTGGLTVLPAKGTTDASGTVTTTVSSGTIPTPVRVQAEAIRNGQKIQGMSDTLTISTGLPIQKNMSISAEKYNLDASKDGVTSTITVLLADQYGNPVSEGTTINFVTEGGAVGLAGQGTGACNTDKTGGCSVQLRTQDFRPANGRVTVLAYVQGLENFTDANGDGQYTAGEPFEDQGDPFLDTNLDKIYNPLDGDRPFPFNHATYQAKGDEKWGLNYIWRQIEVVFSIATSNIPPVVVEQSCTSAGVCTDSGTFVPVACGESGSVTFRIADKNNNPLPVGTQVGVTDPDKLAIGIVSPLVVGSTNTAGGTLHNVSYKRADKDAAGVCGTPSFTLQISLPDNGPVFRRPVK